ncbi:TPA: TnpV protein [Streptococcus equi subsp. zooepidemicus]|nr:TnpV protein [Streptococcus equi subsp. zooepidemicus]HEL1274497.1 TnpV protein [Streptococcus equi subsp. zooepidemicus]
MNEKVTLAGKEYLMEEGIYTPIVKENYFERQGGTYKMEELEEGMEVLIPNMAIPKEIDLKKLNRWGRMRLNFLKENKEEDYQIMYLQGILMDHLLSKEKEIEDFITREEVKMMETWGLTEELKEEDYLKYLRLKKNMDMTLQEIGEREIILI